MQRYTTRILTHQKGGGGYHPSVRMVLDRGGSADPQKSVIYYLNAPLYITVVYMKICLYGCCYSPDIGALIQPFILPLVGCLMQPFMGPIVGYLVRPFMLPSIGVAVLPFMDPMGVTKETPP